MVEKLRRRFKNISIIFKSGRLNPNDQLGRLSVYGIYEMTMSVPRHTHTHTHTPLDLAAVDIEGKHTLE